MARASLSVLRRTRLETVSGAVDDDDKEVALLLVADKVVAIGPKLLYRELAWVQSEGPTKSGRKPLICFFGAAFVASVDVLARKLEE